MDLLRHVCVLSVIVMVTAVAPVYGETFKGVTSSTVINAPKEAVWKVLSTHGHFDDKLKSVDGNEAIVEQKFKSLPLMGVTTVLIKAKVTPTDRIDFEMVKSDRLKAFSGSWVLAPISEKKTRLKLSMFVDPGLPVPRFLVNQFIAGKVRSRLRKVKTLAEKPLSDRVAHH